MSYIYFAKIIVLHMHYLLVTEETKYIKINHKR